MKESIDRRQFLRRSGGALAGVAAATAVAPGATWAAELSALDEHQGNTILQAVRQIYPHNTMSDDYYTNVVKDLDAEAADNAETATMLKEGVASLDTAMGVKWTDLSNGNQFAVLSAMEDSPFFQKLRGKAVVSLYNNPLAWRHFGYEGSSAEQGGYLERGFNDLNWLENPSEDASPKAS